MNGLRSRVARLEQAARRRRAQQQAAPEERWSAEAIQAWDALTPDEQVRLTEGLEHRAPGPLPPGVDALLLKYERAFADACRPAWDAAHSSGG